MHYRIYKLNAAGRIVSGEWIEAEDEAEARRIAHGFCDHDTPLVEVWQGAQQLAVLPCQDDAAARASLSRRSPPPASAGR